MTVDYISLNDGNDTTTCSAHRQSVQRVIRAMNERLDNSLTLQDMADIALFSPYHFNRVFRSTTGVPPTRFLYALRLQEAKRLLLTTSCSVTDICFRVGYNSLGTFTRRFTELVGLSPTKLRCLRDDPCLFASELLSDYRKQPHYGGSHKPNVMGQIQIPSSFSGLVFVGLFPQQIPQSQPVACTFSAMSSTYSITSVPKGCYYLFAAAYSPCAIDPLYLGASEKSLHISSKQDQICTDITLKTAKLVNPPVLTAMPYLFAKHLDDYFKTGD